MNLGEGKMAHNNRCETANPQGICRCSCGGAYHGIAHKHDQYFGEEQRFIRSINKALGGEVGRTIKILSGVPFTCTCGRKQILGGFLGYPHAGGLPDKDGNRWWVFYECEKCRYQWAWHKIVNRVMRQEQLKVQP